jgi:hypothetical protein
MTNLNVKGPATIAAIAVLAFAGALIAPPAAHALPKYAAKEKKPCAYCHVRPNGGGPRNAAGIWYGAHGHSFAGYKPGAGPKPSPKPGAKPSPKPSPKGKKKS